MCGDKLSGIFTLPFLWSTQGRLTLETNWMVGGESG